MKKIYVYDLSNQLFLSFSRKGCVFLMTYVIFYVRILLTANHLFRIPLAAKTFTGWPIVNLLKNCRNDALQNYGPIIVQWSSPIMQSGYFINNFLISLVKLERHHKIHQIRFNNDCACNRYIYTWKKVLQH